MLDTFWALKNIYKIDENGVIENGEVTQLPNFGMLRCPDCWEPSRNTARYELANQLQDVTTTIEHFHSKIGRKLSELHKDFSHSEELLCHTFRGFCKNLKPGPLGGKHNQRAIWDRGNTMLEIQQKATKFRDDIVTPFESNITRLVNFVKNTDILEQVASPFRLRYDLVYFQCRLVTLEDALQVYQHLLKLEPADQHTSIIAEGLRIKIQEQSVGEVLSLGRKITASKDLQLKRIEVELRIIQIGLHMILKKLDIISGLNVSASLSNIRELALRFPDTAGKLLRAFISLRTYVNNGTIPTRFADIYTKDTKELAPLFRQHKMGTLQYCTHKHPFSGSTFANCPECGKEVALPIHQPQVNAHKVLDPQAFLDHFKLKRATIDVNASI
ncbi:hypothetical protein MMC17_000165 [Xylographa soralifera]|nr:hypothetical protein [Xylographa soralifera]